MNVPRLTALNLLVAAFLSSPANAQPPSKEDDLARALEAVRARQRESRDELRRLEEGVERKRNDLRGERDREKEESARDAALAEQTRKARHDRLDQMIRSMSDRMETMRREADTASREENLRFEAELQKFAEDSRRELIDAIRASGREARGREEQNTPAKKASSQPSAQPKSKAQPKTRPATQREKPADRTPNEPVFVAATGVVAGVGAWTMEVYETYLKVKKALEPVTIPLEQSGRAGDAMQRNPIRSDNEQINRIHGLVVDWNNRNGDAARRSAEAWIQTARKTASDDGQTLGNLESERDRYRRYRTACEAQKSAVIALNIADHLDVKDIGQYLVSTKALDIEARRQTLSEIDRCIDLNGRALRGLDQAISRLRPSPDSKGSKLP